MAEHTSRVNWFSACATSAGSVKQRPQRASTRTGVPKAVWSARAGRPDARRAGSEATAASAVCSSGGLVLGGTSGSAADSLGRKRQSGQCTRFLRLV